jgi:hypothetical protein
MIWIGKTGLTRGMAKNPPAAAGTLPKTFFVRPGFRLAGEFNFS